MAEVTWIMKLYDLAGNPLVEIPLDPTLAPDGSETIYGAFSRSVTYNLNGIDELDFSILLSDPMTFWIQPLKTTVSLWRLIDDPIAGKTYGDINGPPDFSGLVTYTQKTGSTNTMTVKVSSPLWRLQTHFHLLNHYLLINPDTDVAYTMSELMWKLIDLVNNAFGGLTSYTGIGLGTFGWGFPFEPSLVPAFIAKGTNTYQYIFDTIMSGTTNGVDIIPEYQHTDGDPTLMLFSTAMVRGTDMTGIDGSGFWYRTEDEGRPSNCDDMTEEIAPQPSVSTNDAGFANYVWTIGQGGANSGKVAVAENDTDTAGYGIEDIGVYMATVQDDSWRTYLQTLSASSLELAVKTVPQTNYTVSVAPGSRDYYGIDFSLGDLQQLSANKGFMSFSGIPQRIYQATLNMSENNIERSILQVSNDYTNVYQRGGD